MQYPHGQKAGETRNDKIDTTNIFLKSETYYTLFEQSPDGILVVDAHGRIVQVNRQIESMFGYEPVELIAQPVEQLIPHLYNTPQIASGFHDDAGSRTLPSHIHVDLLARRKDRTEFPVDIMLTSVDTDHGSFLLIVARDISDRKKEELKAKETRDMFERLFEYAPDAVLVVDEKGRITKMNVKTSELFEYSKDELIGQTVEMLIPVRFSHDHVQHRDRYLKEPRTRPMGAGIDLYAKRKSGAEFPVDIMLSPVQLEKGQGVLAVIRDITERKLAQARETRRREILMKEIHHRVKNNLQVISSLLFLQSQYVSDPTTLSILRESQNRVKSIAKIHEKLHQSNHVEKIDFTTYVIDLVSDLVHSYGSMQEGINVHTSLENAYMGIDTAVPCGLIINELLSNVMQHAFPDRRDGDIWIELKSLNGNRYQLIVKDNGIGFPENFDWRRSHSLGLQLVFDLTKQLGGTIEIDPIQGTTVRIEFNELHYKERG